MYSFLSIIDQYFIYAFLSYRLKTFCKTFVPPDVNEDDMIHYAQTLATDEVIMHNEVNKVCFVINC